METENQKPVQAETTVVKKDMGGARSESAGSAGQSDGQVRSREDRGTPEERRDGNRNQNRNRQDRPRQERGKPGESRPEGAARNESGNRTERNRGAQESRASTGEAQSRPEPGKDRQHEGRANGGRNQRPERVGREQGQRQERMMRESAAQTDAKGTEKQTQVPAQTERGVQRENVERPRMQSAMRPETSRIPKKREESAEDIRSDAERIEKELQFEIKQIQTIKLGM